MADYWEDLEIAELGGLQIPILTKQQTGGRAIVRHKLPNKDGQAIEDQQRRARTWSIVVPLYRGMGPNFYPDRKEEVIELIESNEDKGSTTYLDSEIGEITVKVIEYQWDIDSQNRDGGELTLSIEEDNLSAGVDEIVTIDDRGLSLELAAEFDFLVDELDATVIEEFQQDTNFFDTMVDTVDALFASSDELALALDDYGAYVDKFVNTANKIINHKPFEDASKWAIVNTVIDLVGAVSGAIDSSRGGTSEPEFTTHTVGADASVYDISMKLYGVSYRGDELSFNNAIPNPMNVPKGTALKVLPE